MATAIIFICAGIRFIFFYHINSAIKIKNFLGEYLSSNYSLPDHRGKAAYALWNQQYLEWTNYKTNCQQKRQETPENGQEWEDE